jgi:CDP-diglyceride synthetase
VNSLTEFFEIVYNILPQEIVIILLSGLFMSIWFIIGDLKNKYVKRNTKKSG